MTTDQMHAVADLLRSCWPVVVVVLAVFFRHSLATLIENVAEFRGPGGLRVTVGRAATRQAKKALTTPPPAEANPQTEAAKIDPKMAKMLVSVDSKPLSIEEFLGKVADVYRLPHTPTTSLAASGLLTAYSTTVTATGHPDVKGDLVTIKLTPEIRRILEQKAREDT